MFLRENHFRGSNFCSLSKQTVSKQHKLQLQCVSITRWIIATPWGLLLLGVKGVVRVLVSPTHKPYRYKCSSNSITASYSCKDATQINPNTYIKRLYPGLNDICASNHTTMPWISTRCLFLRASALFLVASLSDSQGELRHSYTYARAKAASVLYYLWCYI